MDSLFVAENTCDYAAAKRSKYPSCNKGRRCIRVEDLLARYRVEKASPYRQQRGKRQRSSQLCGDSQREGYKGLHGEKLKLRSEDSEEKIYNQFEDSPAEIS